MKLNIAFLSLIFSLSALSLHAQQNWGGGVDEQDLHFGFSFQYISSRVKPDINNPTAPGFGLGFVSDWRVGNHANLRFTPSIVFVDRKMHAIGSIESNTIDAPIGFKFKSDRRKNFRAYVIGGIKYSRDIISEKTFKDNPAKFKRNTWWYETGIGFDLYFDYFKLSPEIKLANTLHDVRVDQAIADKVILRHLQFSLYFE